MSDQRILVLTHGEDVDGIVSVALLKMFFEELQIIFVANKDQSSVFQKLAQDSNNLKDRDVFVTDLVLKDELFQIDEFGISIIEEIVNNCKSITWIDHHSQSRKQDFENLGGKFIFGGDLYFCTAEIIFLSLFPFEAQLEDFSRANLLALIAQLNDYPDTSTEKNLIISGNELQRAITCLNYKKQTSQLEVLVDAIYSGDWMLNVDNILRLNNSFLLDAETRFEKNQVVLGICGYSFVVAYVEPILPQKEICRVLRQRYSGISDGCVAFFGSPVNNVMFFSDPVLKLFNAEDFCIYMGGGGRNGDGGYSLTFDLTPETFADAVREFVSSIEMYKKSQSL